ncbi:MAG: His-Xaa-Ser system radical SAM maturase HxsB [Bradyrhizobiaceae bacterium]|nr:MAG: His-Xaa-Ser system radical SAM maturase HxsB [Bradyrhizobiaceae bacterium]
MARFQPVSSFQPVAEELVLLPLRFERTKDARFIVSNLVGDLITLSEQQLREVVSLNLDPGSDLYALASEKFLVMKKGSRASLQLLAMRLRSRMAFLQHPTQLHILVVTLRCEHSCPYCQVSRQSTDRGRYDMPWETAVRAVEVALSTPSKYIKLEFQGGEPLLNFELIERIVPHAKKRAKTLDKELQFVITTNLALLDEHVLAFCLTEDIQISTSLDGPADLHNRNRPRPGGNSHQLAIAGIRRAQAVLGKHRVGALMTTTEQSLGRVEEIVDEYIRLEMDGIFLRPLSPYGFAVKTKQFFRYDAGEWLRFYEQGLRYILKINRDGRYFPEFYAALILRRMLTDRRIGYVDLRSPAGIGLGALVYNYDGKVFASDEGRMLAEMGDRSFELGALEGATYVSLILSDKLVDMVSASLTQCAPQCSTCVFEPHCGADPVYHHATQGDPVGIKPLSEFCARQKGIMTLLMRLLEESPEDAAILRRWAA